MSPRRRPETLTPAQRTAIRRLAIEAGAAIQAERRRRRLTLVEVANLSGIGRSPVHRLDSGETGSLESYVRVASALSLKVELRFEGPGAGRERLRRDEDFVHAAMGELEARHFRGMGFQVAIDEPYQHYQFAGRADVVAWDLERRTLLHLENRTRFPNIQEVAGSFNAKRAYLPHILADRLGLGGNWRTVDHVIAVAWSSECLHALRLRRSTFEALCPDSVDSFSEWGAGSPPTSGERRTLIALDPIPGSGPRSRRV